MVAMMRPETLCWIVLMGAAANEATAAPGVTDAADACPGLAASRCKGQGRDSHCFHYETGKCERSRAHSAEADLAWETAAASHRLAAESFRDAARRALRSENYEVAAARLSDHLVASVDASRIAQERLRRSEQAVEMLLSAHETLQAERAKHPKLAGPRLAEAIARLGATMQAIPEITARQLTESARVHAASGARDGDRDMRISALGLYRQAASQYREAWRRAQDREWRTYLFQQEMDCLARARDLRQVLGVRQACSELQELATRFNEISRSSDGADEATRKMLARFQRVNDLDHEKCRADLLASDGTAYLHERRHREAAEVFIRAADRYRAILTSSLADQGRLAAEAFPEALARSAWIVETTTRAVESYQHGSRALRDDRGRATAAGRRLEAEARGMLEQLALTRGIDAGTRRRIEEITVQTIPKRRSQLLYPDGDIITAGAVVLGLGGVGIAVGSAFTYKVWHAQQESGCLDAATQTCDADKLAPYLGETDGLDAAAKNRSWRLLGLGASVAGGAVASVGAAILVAGLIKRRSTRASARRATVQPVLTPRVVGLSARWEF
jgi:tetratricopeptide (TPR) repeat protein